MTGNSWSFTPPEGAVRFLKGCSVLGGGVLLAGMLLAPERLWPNLLLVSYFVLGLGLAGACFVALEYVTGAGWSVVLRRVPEAMCVGLPLGASGLAAVLLLKPSLYPWMGGPQHEAEAILGFQRAWLNWPFFLGRTAVYVVSWMALVSLIVRTSRRQDEDGDASHTHRNVRLSTAFLVVFGATFWLASYDWVMSLEPHWYSTIFGVYNFAGLFLGGLAAIVALVVWLRRLGAWRDAVTENHLHDLGRLLFAFSTFWAYIWFCQYMLIWYANIPEETSYFVRRQHGAWGSLFVLNLLLNWAIPFLVLLPRANKRSATVLARTAAVILLGRWLDLYLMIAPPFSGPKPLFGFWEVGLMLGAAAVFLLVLFRDLRKVPLVPIQDPFLIESLHHHS